jgi:hypothetical protein
MRSSRLLLAVPLTLWAVACTALGPGLDGGEPDAGEPDARGPDAGGPDAGRPRDGGSAPDAGPPRDAGQACAPPCSKEQACVRGRCVPTCGAEVAALERALSPALTVLGGCCLAPEVSAFAVPRDSFYAVRSSVDGGARLFELRNSDGCGLEGEVYAVSVAQPPGVALRPTHLLTTASRRALSDSFVFGYTTDAPGAPGALLGFFYEGIQQRGFSLETRGPVQATNLDTGEQLLVAGDALGSLSGAGAYAYTPSTGALTQLLALGEGRAGGIASFLDFILVGATAPDGGEAAYAFEERWLDAGTLSVTDPRVRRLALPASFVRVGPTLLATERRAGPLAPLEGLEVRTVGERLEFLPPGAPVQWTFGPAFDRAQWSGYGAVLLHHDKGVWIVQ